MRIGKFVLGGLLFLFLFPLGGPFCGLPVAAYGQESSKVFLARFHTLNRATAAHLAEIEPVRWKAPLQLVNSTAKNLDHRLHFLREGSLKIAGRLEADPTNLHTGLQLASELAAVTDALEIHQGNVARYESKRLAAQLKSDAQEYRSLLRWWRAHLIGIAERQDQAVRKLRAQAVRLQETPLLAERALKECDAARRRTLGR